MLKVVLMLNLKLQEQNAKVGLHVVVQLLELLDKIFTKLLAHAIGLIHFQFIPLQLVRIRLELIKSQQQLLVPQQLYGLMIILSAIGNVKTLLLAKVSH
jgi:hypothetical protein